VKDVDHHKFISLVKNLDDPPAKIKWYVIDPSLKKVKPVDYPF
jgi:hypothetical protein